MPLCWLSDGGQWDDAALIWLHVLHFLALWQDYIFAFALIMVCLAWSSVAQTPMAKGIAPSEQKPSWISPQHSWGALFEFKQLNSWLFCFRALFRVSNAQNPKWCAGAMEEAFRGLEPKWQPPWTWITTSACLLTWCYKYLSFVCKPLQCVHLMPHLPVTVEILWLSPSADGRHAVAVPTTAPLTTDP